MEVDVATYHMKRCVDSGLWVPNAAESLLNEDTDEIKLGSKNIETEESSNCESNPNNLD